LKQTGFRLRVVDYENLHHHVHTSARKSPQK